MGFIGILAGAAFLLAKYVQRGPFFNDLLYHIFRNVWNVPPEQAAYFATDLQNKYWHQLVLLHGGAYRGTYSSVLSSVEKRFDFEFHAPLLLSHGLLFGMVAAYGWLIRRIVRKQLVSDAARLGWAAGFSMLYALGVMLLLSLVNPESVYLFGAEHSELQVSASFGRPFITAFVVCFLGTCMGLGGWSFLNSGNWMSWLKSVRHFMLSMVGFSTLIAGLMIVQWALVDNSRVYNPHIVTMGSLWKEYKQEPAIYAILPNILLQEQIYSLGGTWHIDGMHAARFLGASAPFQLNLLSGIKGLEGGTGTKGGDAARSGLENELQVSWYHFAFLLAYAYSLSRIKMHNAVMLATATLSIVIGFAFLSRYFNVWIAATGGTGPEGRVGFHMLQTGMAVGIGTLAILSLSFVAQLLVGVKEGKVTVGA
ncbi:hypothetical protein [Paenibacillus koleovorans]|uniref:hypothetical protein n=1 Tax=Paenibacillus koleovorans TaxID=121608 RepID=UPI000FD8D6A0|nr:hypothetical protein [Paenibacillus koleovorans]